MTDLLPRSAAGTPPAAGPVHGAGWLAVGAVAAKAVQTAVLLLFAAVLEPDAFGVISLGAVLLNLTTVVADLGTATALVHFRGDVERAARTAATIALTSSCALVLLVWTTAPALARFLHVGDLGTDVFRGVVLCTPFAAVAGVSGELLRRALEFRRRVLPDVAGNVVGGVATVTALAGGQGALSLVYGQLAQAVVVLLLFWWVRPRVRPGWSGPDAAALVSYGAGIAGSGVLTLVLLNVDYVLVAHHLGAAEVGIYSMAFRIAYMPYLLIAVVIGGAAFAHLCRQAETEVWRTTVEVARRVHVLVIPAYLLALVLAPQLQLLGDRWAPAVPALRWLAVYGLLLSALEMLLVALRSVGRTTDVLGLAALHLVALVVLLVLYVDRGVTAVAISQVVAGLLTLVAAAWVVGRRLPDAGWRRPALCGSLVAAAAAAGAVAVEAPSAALLCLVALAAGAVAVLRVEWVAVVYVAAEPFGDLLRDVHPAAIKVLGAVLVVSWLVRLAREPHPAGLRHPALVALGALTLVLLASFAAHGADLATGRDHTVTYAAYAVVVVVLVDTVRRGRPDPTTVARALALAYALSATLAGAVALVGFLQHGGRAAGPLADPNDLAFFLVAALPLLLVVRPRSAAATVLLGGCAAVLVVATFATFSRGALVALAVMAVVALLLGAVRPRSAVALGVAALVALGALWATHADVVARAVEEKDHVAAANVDLRVTTATMAAEMAVDSPLLGQGPGGFAAESARFVPADVAHVDQAVAHQMYLDVAAELGLLGLGSFLLVLGYAVRGALRARRSPELRPLGTGVTLAFVGTLVAACFLSEQLYLPVWLLVALAVAVDPDRGGRKRWW